MTSVRANDHIIGLDDVDGHRVSSVPLITTPRSHTSIYVPLDAVCNSPTSTTGSASILEYNSNSDGDMESYLQADPPKSNFPSMPTKTPTTGMFPLKAVPICPDSLSSPILTSLGMKTPWTRHARVLDVNSCAAVHESDTVGFDISCTPSHPAKTLPDQCRMNARIFCHGSASLSGSDAIAVVSNESYAGSRPETITVGRGTSEGKDNVTTRAPDVPCLTYRVHAEKLSTTSNNFVSEWKAVVEGKASKRSQFQEPPAVNTRSPSPESELLVSPVEQAVDSQSIRSTPDSTDGLAELTASMMTVKPRRPSVLTSRGGESLFQISGFNSRSSPSHSDQDYTFEVRPPSATRVTQDAETTPMAHPEGLHPFFTPPMLSATPPPRLRLSSCSGSIMPGSRPMSESVPRELTPPFQILPVPPIPSVRSRTTQRLEVAPVIPCQTISTPRFASSLPVNATTKDSLPRTSSTTNVETYCTGHSRTSQTHRSVQVVEDIDSSDSERSSTSTDITMQNDEFLSLSPLTWDYVPTTQQPTSDAVPLYRTLRSSSPTISHLTAPWVPPTQTTRPSGVRHLNSTPEIIEPSARTSSERMNGRYTQFARGSTLPSTPAFGTIPTLYTNSPATLPLSRASPPSGPQRRTRFASTLPSSPGSSLRTSAFNSPYYSNGSTSSGSWGTPSTTLDPISALPTSTTSRPVSRSTSSGSWGIVPAWSSETNESHPWSTSHSNLSDVDLLRPPGSHSTQSPTFSRFLLICGTCGCPPITCVCGRRARVSAATSSRIRTPTRQGSAPHPVFWFADGTVVLEVEDALFRVHKYFLERDSDQFKNMFGRSSSSPAHIHRISDTKKQDFERLLKVFYPSSLTNPDLITVEEWTSVLTVAVRWHMDEIISLAIQKLTPITPAVDKIALAKKFGLFVAPNSSHNRDWLLPALQELCTRNLPLRLEEAKKLDMWTVLKVWEVQFELSHSGVAQNISDIEQLIKRRFGLE